MASLFYLLMLNDVIKGSAPHLQAKLLCPGQTDRFPPTAEEEVLTDAKVKHSRLAFLSESGGFDHCLTL